jgi:hypothetical protein
MTAVRKAETMARTKRDVGVDGSEDAGAGGNVDDSEDGNGANRADDDAGDGVVHRCRQR